MIEQLKNKNEYREDGKIYIKKFRSCLCSYLAGDTYTLYCGLNERGEHDYEFKRDRSYILKKYDTKKLWLTGEARNQLEGELAGFDAAIKAAQNGETRGITIEGGDLSIYYKEVRGGGYDFLVNYLDRESGENVWKSIAAGSIEDFLWNLSGLRREEMLGKELADLIWSPTQDNIDRHPLIMLAGKYGDVKLEKRVKIHFRLADSEDCSILAGILNLRILPALPEEYNKTYVIDNDTIGREEWKLLIRSGYDICHRPYFSMMGYTHSKIMLNPCRKTGVDAAGAEAPSMAFCDFLEMFEGK